MKRIIFLSILKPIDDPRMYKKMAVSLAATRKYEVHIIGYRAPIPSTYLPIYFYPIFSFTRLSWKRAFTFWKILRILIKVKPHIIIPNTHENLIVSIVYKILFGGKVIYDLRENYFRNIWYQRNYPFLIRHLLAIYVRIKEYIAHLFINNYILAEKIYLKEFLFTKNKSILIENKYLPEENLIANKVKKPIQEPIHFIYSGTIAEIYGIKEAIKLVISLYQMGYNITLCIIGYCSKNQLVNEIKVILKDHPYITLIGGTAHVPHSKIVEQIKNSTIALTPYKPNRSTEGCIPTKFYEYIAHQIPIIFPSDNSSWESFISSFNAGIAWDFQNSNISLLMNNINNISFYNNKYDLKEILWDYESKKLINLFFRLG